MTMSTTDIILIITTVTTSIVAIIGAIKLKEIAHSVNSAASQATSDNKALAAEVASLKADKAVEREKAALLAQSAAARPLSRATDTASPVLESIEANTRETAKGVQDLKG